MLWNIKKLACRHYNSSNVIIIYILIECYWYCFMAGSYQWIFVFSEDLIFCLVLISEMCSSLWDEKRMNTTEVTVSTHHTTPSKYTILRRSKGSFNLIFNIINIMYKFWDALGVGKFSWGDVEHLKLDALTLWPYFRWNASMKSFKASEKSLLKEAYHICCVCWKVYNAKAIFATGLRDTPWRAIQNTFIMKDNRPQP